MAPASEIASWFLGLPLAISCSASAARVHSCTRELSLFIAPPEKPDIKPTSFGIPPARVTIV